MRQLGFDNDLIVWTLSFWTNKKVEIIINRYINSEKDINTRIL